MGDEPQTISADGAPLSWRAMYEEARAWGAEHYERARQLAAENATLRAQVELEHNNRMVSATAAGHYLDLLKNEQLWAEQLQRKVDRYYHALVEMKNNCCMGTADCHCIRCETVEPISHSWPQASINVDER